MSENELVLSEVSNPSVLDSIYELRVVAWRGTIEIPSLVTKWNDEVDTTARHWAVMLGERVVAAARLSFHSKIADVPHAEVYWGVVDCLPSPIGSLNRCVVHPKFRGRNLGEALDQARIGAARESGCRSLIISAPDARRASKLASEGFEFRGDGPITGSGFLKGNRNIIFVLNL